MPANKPDPLGRAKWRVKLYLIAGLLLGLAQGVAGPIGFGGLRGPIVAVLIIVCLKLGEGWGFQDAYKLGYADGVESEHYFDDYSVLDGEGKPYGPGPLWCGTEPMDYPDPRCVCGALWIEDQCMRHLFPPGDES